MHVTNGFPLGCPLPLTGWHYKFCRNTEGTDITLPGVQTSLLLLLAATPTKLIIVLLGGSAMTGFEAIDGVHAGTVSYSAPYLSLRISNYEFCHSTDDGIFIPLPQPSLL